MALPRGSATYPAAVVLKESADSYGGPQHTLRKIKWPLPGNVGKYKGTKTPRVAAEMPSNNCTRQQGKAERYCERLHIGGKSNETK